MLLHHRNWPVLPPNGRAQGQPGAGVDPLSDGTGVAPAHVPTLPAATSARRIEPYNVPAVHLFVLYPPFWASTVSGSSVAGPLSQQPPVSVLEEFYEVDQTDSESHGGISSHYGDQKLCIP